MSGDYDEPSSGRCGSETVSAERYDQLATILWRSSPPRLCLFFSGFGNYQSSELGSGLLSRFLAKISFAAKRYGGYDASLLARFAVWSSGACRRQNAHPRSYSCPGAPLELLPAQKSAEQLSARCSRPALDHGWRATKLLSY